MKITFSCRPKNWVLCALVQGGRGRCYLAIATVRCGAKVIRWYWGLNKLVNHDHSLDAQSLSWNPKCRDHWMFWRRDAGVLSKTSYPRNLPHVPLTFRFFLYPLRFLPYVVGLCYISFGLQRADRTVFLCSICLVQLTNNKSQTVSNVLNRISWCFFPGRAF